MLWRVIYTVLCLIASSDMSCIAPQHLACWEYAASCTYAQTIMPMKKLTIMVQPGGSALSGCCRVPQPCVKPNKFNVINILEAWLLCICRCAVQHALLVSATILCGSMHSDPLLISWTASTSSAMYVYSLKHSVAVPYKQDGKWLRECAVQIPAVSMQHA